MCTPGLKFNERKRTYPSDQSGAQFTKVFEIKSTNPRIKLTANEEIIDGVSWKGKVLTQTVQPLGGVWRAQPSTPRAPVQPLGSPAGSGQAGVRTSEDGA